MQTLQHPITIQTRTISPYSNIPMSEEIHNLYPKGYFEGKRKDRKINLPSLSEIRKHWHGKLEPELPDKRYSATGTRLNRRGWLTEISYENEGSLKGKEIRRTRKQWLDAICLNDWPLVKPELQVRGNPDSWLIRNLIHDPDYLRMYIEYLKMKRKEPTPLLLQELKRQGYRSIASEIAESVMFDSEDF